MVYVLSNGSNDIISLCVIVLSLNTPPDFGNTYQTKQKLHLQQDFQIFLS